MKTLASQATKQMPIQAIGNFESKGSKFLSFLFPFAQFNESLSSLKEQHPKAVHFVSASRHYNEYGQILESFDDDKEPRGSSGTPSLNVLRGEELIEVGVVIVRYFGGTLLGVGGLVRAPKRNAANRRRYAEQDIPWVEFILRLKSTGMPIREIKRYAALRREGDKTLAERMELLVRHREALDGQIRELEGHSEKLAEKIAFYQSEILRYTESIDGSPK